MQGGQKMQSLQQTQGAQQTHQQQPPFYIDSHTHLLDYDRESHLSLTEILKESQLSNIKYIAANACCTNQFQPMQHLYLTSSSPTLNIIPCYGIHPCYICEQLKQQNQHKDWKSMLKKYLTKHPLSHVGEIGLDFRKDVIETNPQQKQWQFFEFQFQLAIEMKRSVTIHCVRAYGELLKYFKKWNTKCKQLEEKPIIILHSYGGSKQITKSILKLQHLQVYFSLSLKHSKDILEVIPLQKIILQTDAPYQNDHSILIQSNLLSKEQLQKEESVYQEFLSKNLPNTNLLKECKFFNKSILDNRPKNVIANYRQLSKIFKLEEEALCRKITLNALRAFKLVK